MKIAVMTSLLAEGYVYVNAAHFVVFSVPFFSNPSRGSDQFS
ncbi:hypothetical protein [Flavobacterium frigoris]|uniref:Uncharacterized protein n=1 Tax=Flavobacterium frigoris (strain PS1) TaxID=1086011 RepID=H7FP78_FLAFP|nr:hypothetical protein [Flavobacterium frigoris]EIA09558.1 hypothetical protein HJ01_00976 [Flavobacterium frigoris PS1]